MTLQDLSLHILDIAENSTAAHATRIEITIDENIRKNRLLFRIRDNGRGMTKQVQIRALDPFFTTKKVRRVGLGLPMLAQAAREAGGRLTIRSRPGSGTSITARFVFDHIDRKPIGNMAETIINLVAGHGRNIDFLYKYRKNDLSYIFDTRIIKRSLRDVPITDPEVLSFLKKEIIKGQKALEKRRIK
jgi:hypothetical protein